MRAQLESLNKEPQMPSTINNVNIYPFESEAAILDYIGDKKTLLIAINALKIVNVDESIRKIINDNIGYADGAGVVLALKRKGFKKVIKMPGCELWLKIVEKYHKQKSFYLIGGKQESIERTVEKLKTEYPGITVVGFRNGFFGEEEKMALLQDLVKKRPDVVFVAMGSPKQELLMNELFSSYPALYQGLGGSFDVYSDNVQRAPQWLIDRNLEWAYRLFKQPSRIIRQFSLIKFMFRVIVGIY
jgi:UDP-N-acetyl-D-mannosaminouronate:lipid I N-acetyl-D-mannosaminouronosyltransferase